MRTALLVALMGCTFGQDRIGPGSGPPGLPGTGISATQVRQVPEFSGVRTETFVDVIASVGPAHRVDLTCDDRLLPHIDTVVHDGVLVVSLRASAGTTTPAARCLLKATAPTWDSAESAGPGAIAMSGTSLPLRRAWAAGSGNVVVTGVDAETVVVGSTGSGVVRLSGRAHGLDKTTARDGEVDVEGLRVGPAETGPAE